jgi:hypothetical protein
VVDDTVQRLNVDARVIRNSDPMIKFWSFSNQGN